MSAMNLEEKRKRLDREITFFHFKRAERIADKCIREAERRGDAFFLHYFTAQKYILREDFRRAIKYLDYALSIRSNDGCAYSDKAISLAELGRYRQALNCFNEGIRRDKDCVSLYHNKGWLLTVLGKHQIAIIYFHKALELEANRVESLYSLGDCWYHLKDKSKAKIYFKAAYKLIKGKSSFMHQEVLRRIAQVR